MNGSTHNAKELEHAIKICKELEVGYRIIKLNLKELGIGSSLLNTDSEIPKWNDKYENLISTVIPFRNAILISVATGVAESEGFSSVFIASNATDAPTSPDCGAEFNSAMARAIQLGTHGELSLMSPFEGFSKRRIAIIGKKMGVDFTETWSCFKSGEHHCGECSACKQRKESLEGFDLTIYEK